MDSQILDSTVSFAQAHSIDVMSFVALVLSLAGNALINFRKRIGFFVWILSNVAWIAVNLMGTPNWSQIAMFVVYVVFNVHGWMKWGKIEEK